MRQLDEVEEAAAVAVPDSMRREEVKVYLMLRSGLSETDCPPDMVINHCRTHLASFKVPRHIAYVEEFPRTPSRKIAKNKLLGGDLTIGAYDRVDDIRR